MVTLTFGLSSVELKNPKLGNRRVLNLRTTIKRSMTGKIWAYAHRPALITLTLDFHNMNRAKILETINFLRDSAGQEITYLDHRDLLWTGKILTMPFEAQHVHTANNDFTLTFEGTHP